MFLLVPFIRYELYNTYGLPVLLHLVTSTQFAVKKKGSKSL